ncbi:hypothetical protein PILCRDRAFT_385422 [Piloderma croceum F 1598]|uniref:Uncharacterized protein n=1 Tax=Piloderma croceum (strain F 1598) TaxID=765440 RepID=A0A0C3BDX3_PILCF|nr:hypothetical protein PILCRDRAFT_385422 [Piloderma croceum F 1598]
MYSCAKFSRNTVHRIAYFNSVLFGPSQPPLKPTSKDERGLENDNTGRHLCPGEYKWDDAEIRALTIRKGHADFLVTAQSWPVFLYAGHKCNEADMEEGLFKSALLLKAYKYIFTSPTSANNVSVDVMEAGNDNMPPAPKRSNKNLAVTRSHVASLIGLRKVTPRLIAYVSVQLRFALSSANAWRVVDIDFNHEEFYTVIVDYFEITPGPVAAADVANLLAWWNRKVFGRTSGAPQPAQQYRTSSSVSTVAAQHRARETDGGF